MRLLLPSPCNDFFKGDTSGLGLTDASGRDWNRIKTRVQIDLILETDPASCPGVLS
jgi:hypothetical protein